MNPIMTGGVSSFRAYLDGAELRDGESIAVEWPDGYESHVAVHVFEDGTPYITVSIHDVTFKAIIFGWLARRV